MTFAVKSKDALLFGEDLEDISIGGRGTIDGQAKYVWAPDTTQRNFSHKILGQRLGKSQMRSYPEGFPKRDVYPHLLWLGRCRNVSSHRLIVRPLAKLDIRPFRLFPCEDQRRVHLYQPEGGCLGDGIDTVSSSDVTISDSTIAAGDDCIVFVCGIPDWGPRTPCENVTVTDCRLSSASAAIKFSEGNSNLIRRILVNNCAIFDTNRGLTLQIATGGTIRDVVISNLTMDLHRFDWFWAGDGNAFNLETKRSFRITTRVTVNWPPRGLTPELQRECGVIWER